MPLTILGRKVGMTRLFDADGNNIPVTVIQAGPCHVTQVKSADKDGYDAVQIAFEDVKGRNTTTPLIGHDAKAGVPPKRFHAEFRVDADQQGGFEIGKPLTVEAFSDVKFVDVTGTSKGKGTAGPMKRHNYRGQQASHGVERKHRSPGSIGGRAANLGTGKPKKGIRMAGRMGNERVTVRSLEVVGIDKDKNLILVRGPIPGARKGLVRVRQAVRLYKRKAKLAKAS